MRSRRRVGAVAGDFLYSSSPSVAAQVDTVVRQLAPLVDAGIATYAVLGNHDHAVGGAEESATALEDAGVDVLSNDAVALVRRGSDDRGAGDEAGADDPRALHLVGPGAPRWSYHRAAREHSRPPLFELAAP